MIRGYAWKINKFGNILSSSSLLQRYSSSISLTAPNGTRDFYPNDIKNRTVLHSQWKTIAKLYGFEQVDTPVVEYEELYDRSSHETLFHQYYRFQDSSKGHKLHLKADMTPSLCRLIVAHHPQATYPAKWFSIPQIWRFDNNSPNSRKEHYQWNMDIWGVPGVEAEAELISAAVMAMKNMGLKSSDVVIKISNRKIISEIMSGLGVPSDKIPIAYVIIDKLLHGISSQKDSIQYDEVGITKSIFDEIINQLKVYSLKQLQESEGVKEINKLLTILDQYSISDWVQFDATIVRGLAYYTGIVFEAFDREGGLKSICGGGRYNDMLLPMFVIHGEYPTSAVGFGMDDSIVEILLKKKELELKAEAKLFDADILMYCIPEDIKHDMYKCASALRSNGDSVAVLGGNSIPSPKYCEDYETVIDYEVVHSFSNPSYRNVK